MFGVLQAAAPELWRTSTWTQYAIVQRRLAAQMKDTATADQIPQLVREQAIDVMLREYPGMAVLKVAAAALPLDQATAFEDVIHAQADKLGDTSTTVAGDAIYAPDAQPSGALQQSLFDASRVAYGAREVSVAAGVDAPTGLTMDWVLQSTPAAAADRLGATAAKAAVAGVKKDTAELVAACNALGGSARASDPAFWTAYGNALTKSNGNVSKALDLMTGADYEQRRRKNVAGASANKAGDDAAVAGALKKVLSVAGAKGFDDVATLLQPASP